MSFGLDQKPRLVEKARLRLDRKNGQHVLLYPEKGLLLNPTGAAILKLCTGELTLRQIIETLAEQFKTDPSQIQPEVLAFVGALSRKRLLKVVP